MAKQKIKSPLASLNGYDEKNLQEVFLLELEASNKTLNKAQQKVITAYSGYQPIVEKEEKKTGFMNKGLSMIESMVFKDVKATSQTYLYHSLDELPDSLKNMKVGDMITVPSIFTASASPIFAQSLSTASGYVFMIEKAKATPLPEEDDDKPTWSYVINSNSKFNVKKFERRTWVHGSKISKNVTLVTLEMI